VPASSTTTDRPSAILAPSDTVRDLTVTEIAARKQVKPHVVLALIRSGELPATNWAAPGSKRPRWRIAPSDLAAFETRRAAVPAQQPAPKRKRQVDDVALLDPVTGKVRREFRVVGSIKGAAG
jgi:hypothetical protein